MKNIIILAFISFQIIASEIIIFDANKVIFQRDESTARKITGIGLEDVGLGGGLKLGFQKAFGQTTSLETDLYDELRKLESEFHPDAQSVKIQASNDSCIKNDNGDCIPPLLLEYFQDKRDIRELAAKLSPTSQKAAKALELSNLTQIVKVNPKILRLLQKCNALDSNKLYIFAQQHEKFNYGDIFNTLSHTKLIPGIMADIDQLMQSEHLNPQQCLFISSDIARLKHAQRLGMKTLKHAAPGITEKHLRSKKLI
ncbi:hypothetical protein A3F66_05585 [candidate division TM6 bacterium RIFCSPHIGHO2_12_FULL_32_22]|nr:MAG: hypothetical protein A3F66_05585 [candidate division TM6 bacterium RIFCSPHIGHO2_12_FULL_32_22]